jgi:hypothetical protein
LEWIGHVARIDRGGTVTKVFWSRPEERRRRVRPRLRWLEDAEKDPWEMSLRDGDRRQSIGKYGRPLLMRPRLSDGRRDVEPRSKYIRNIFLVFLYHSLRNVDGKCFSR